MFSITKYEYDFLEKESERLKIFFKYFGESTKKVKVRILEDSFKVRYQEIGGIINVNKNTEYWVQDIQNRPLLYHNNVTVNFLDADTEEIIDSKFLNTSKVNINKRSFGQDFSIKNTWIIGDSHVNHNLIFEINYDMNLYYNGNTIINPVANTGLSINRFVNSDYVGYLKNLPIFENDNICFYFGEIDTRIGIIKNSKIKGITYIEHMFNLIKRFIDSILIIKKEFPKCNFYYILPNPPIQDGWICDDNIKLFLGESNEKNRFVVRYSFEEIIKYELDRINVEVIDLSSNYTKSNMFVDEKFLINNNHHFKYPNNFLDLLKEYFK